MAMNLKLTTCLGLAFFLWLAGCSGSPNAAADKSSPKDVAVEKPKLPVVSEEQRKLSIEDLNERIGVLEDYLKKLAHAEGMIEVVAGLKNDASPEVAKEVDVEKMRRDAKSVQEEKVKQLVETVAMRDLADVSAERKRKLVDAIIDRCREKHFPMFSRSNIAERIGNRADKPAAQLAVEVSNKVVYGFVNEYDGPWLLGDANTFAKTRIDEIADSIASQISR